MRGCTALKRATFSLQYLSNPHPYSRASCLTAHFTIPFPKAQQKLKERHQPNVCQDKNRSQRQFTGYCLRATSALVSSQQNHQDEHTESILSAPSLPQNTTYARDLFPIHRSLSKEQEFTQTHTNIKYVYSRSGGFKGLLTHTRLTIPPGQSWLTSIGDVSSPPRKAICFVIHRTVNLQNLT